MTTPVWQPGTLYIKGNLVRPQTAPSTTAPSIANPDFEDGDTDWIKGTGFSIVTGQSSFTGTYSAKYQNSPNTNAFIEASAYTAITPGTQVVASCMVNQGASDANDAGGSVWLRWYDSSNAFISGSQGNVIKSGSGGAFSRSSVIAVAPANAAYVRIAGECYLLGSGQALYLDAFSWSIAAAAIPAGLIYKAVQDDPGTSANTEPDWPTTLGVQVIDNTVTWEAVNTNRVVWEASPILTTGATEPTWPTVPGETVVDGTVAWECVSRRVEDENCPNTKVVAIISSKVFAVDRDIVRFCATANPLDWTSELDAGYLPTGLQQANANDMAVLDQYRGNLVAFNASSFQNWQVDPDPAQMAILDQMDGIGSTWPRAAQPVSNELLYLSQLGVRSVSIAAGADNLAAGDIGTPIDTLVQASVAALTNPSPLAKYYPSAGQYWLAMSTQAQPYALTIAGNLANGTVGDSGTYHYTSAGGMRPHVFSILSGSLPPGATMDSAGLVTFDYTTTGDFTWTVQVEDAAGNVATCPDTAEVVGPQIVVWNQGSKILSLVDETSLTESAGIAVATGTNGQAYQFEVRTGSGRKAYLRDRSGGHFWQIDLATQEVTQMAGFVGVDATGFVLDGSIAYVAHGSSNVVRKFDLATGTQLAVTAGLASSVFGLAIAPAGDYLYTSSGSTIVKIRTSDMAIVATSAAGTVQVRGIAVSPDGASVYVGGSGSLDPIVRRYLASDLSQAAATTRTNDLGQDVICDDAGAYLYAIAYDDAASTYEVVKFDATTLAEVANVNIDQAQGGMLAFSSDGANLYASNGSQAGTADTVSVVDLATFAVVGSITVRNSPSGIALVQA